MRMGMRISGTSRLCGLETGSGFLALFLGCYVNRPSLERPERGDGHGAILDDLADQARNHHLQRLRGPEALGERAPPARAGRWVRPRGRARNCGARAEARLGRIVEAPHDEEAETGKVGSHRGHELREERGIRFMATTAAGIPIVTAVSRPPPSRETPARGPAALLRFCCCGKLRTAGFPLLIGSV